MLCFLYQYLQYSFASCFGRNLIEGSPRLEMQRILLSMHIDRLALQNLITFFKHLRSSRCVCRDKTIPIIGHHQKEGGKKQERDYHLSLGNLWFLYCIVSNRTILVVVVLQNGFCGRAKKSKQILQKTKQNIKIKLVYLTWCTLYNFCCFVVNATHTALRLV